MKYFIGFPVILKCVTLKFEVYKIVHGIKISQMEFFIWHKTAEQEDIL